VWQSQLACYLNCEAGNLRKPKFGQAYGEGRRGGGHQNSISPTPTLNKRRAKGTDRRAKIAEGDPSVR